MEQDAFPHIGTSGWHYSHWKGAFYPPGLGPSGWLEFYSRHFDTVEINSSFYRLPERTTFEAWRNRTPENFVFAVKASRFITHVKKLRDAGETIPRFMERADGLGKKLGIVLFQLPPGLGFDPGRFDAFLRALPAGYRYACEFRNPEWFTERCYSMLESRGVSFCIHDAPNAPTPPVVTGSRVYVRLHGSVGMYQGEYTEDQLMAWTDRIGEWRGRVETVYVYFNNDMEGFAVRSALRLRELAMERLGAPSR